MIFNEQFDKVIRATALFLSARSNRLDWGLPVRMYIRDHLKPFGPAIAWYYHDVVGINTWYHNSNRSGSSFVEFTNG